MTDKLYYCAEKKAICSVECSKGKELKHYPEASQESLEGISTPDMEYVQGFVPGKRTTHLKFKDGTEETIDGVIEFIEGCD